MSSIDLDPLYEVLKIVTDIAPIAITIGLVLFVIGLIFYMIVGNRGGKLVESLRIDKKMIIAMATMGMLILGAFGASGATQAEAMKLDSSIVYGGTVVTLEVTGLTVDTEYTIWATGNSETIANRTFTASSSTEFVPFGIPDDSDGSFTLNIASSTSGAAASAVGTLFVSLTDPGGFLLVDFFFNILVPLILILLVVGILVGIKTGVVGKGMGKFK